MPEIPEVNLFVKNINKSFHNSILKNIIIHSGRYKRHSKPKFYKKFLSFLPLHILSFNSKGKFIYIILENNLSIWITLGLTGSIITTPNLPHNNIEFITNNGSFFLNDPRNFGTIKFCLDKNSLDKKLNSLGPDIFSQKLPFESFKNLLLNYPNEILATILVNQKILSGLGNYLRTEVLYNAKLNPFRKINSLSNKEFKNLYISTYKIPLKYYKLLLKYGIDYNITKIYGIKNNSNIKFKKLNKRTIYWNILIQK